MTNADIKQPKAGRAVLVGVIQPAEPDDGQYVEHPELKTDAQIDAFMVQAVEEVRRKRMLKLIRGKRAGRRMQI